MVLRLLEAGADYRIRNNDGEDLAYRTARFEIPGDDKSDFGRQVEKVIAFLEGKGLNMGPAEESRRVAETQPMFN